MHFFNRFIEIQQFGFNAVTVALIGTIVFGLVQAWGQQQQIQQIRQDESIKSISLPYVCYFCIHFVALTIYGIRHNLLAFVAGGLILGPMYIRLLDTAIRHGANIDVPRYIFWLFTVAGVFIIVPKPVDYVLITSCYFIGTFFIFMIPWEIWKKKDIGSVNGKMLVTVSSTIAFWIVYSACVGDWMLFGNCAASLVALGYTGYLFSCESFRRALNTFNGNA